MKLQITDTAVNKIQSLLSNKNNSKLKLRIYINGGGCSGFKYSFILDEKVNKGDIIIEKQGIELIIDCISIQYLIGSSIDYVENLTGSKFIVNNPNAKMTCSCGLSFSI
ncbi:MAG: iron-sulfur cluster insertion protein ErpA [Pantoea sp. Brub]|nr:iron-sulfur cluster insertion protein ErpA [Pantoea sp. Brub]